MRSGWWVRACLILALSVSAGAVDPPATFAQSDGSRSECSAVFPQLEWRVSRYDGVELGAAGVDPGITTRIGEVAGTVVAWLRADLGPQAAMTVCLVGADEEVSDLQLIPSGQQLNSIVLAERRTVVASTRLLRLVEPAVGFGLAYVALWDLAASQGASGYPEPLASTVARWYGTRVTGRQALHHAAMRGANFFETEAQIDWATGSQSPVLVYNEDYNESPLDDMVDHAVKTRGAEVLAVTDGPSWAEIEAEWRTELRFELTGRRTPTTGWIIGLVMVVALGVAALATAWLGRRQRRRYG